MKEETIITLFSAIWGLLQWKISLFKVRCIHGIHWKERELLCAPSSSPQVAKNQFFLGSQHYWWWLRVHRDLYHPCRCPHRREPSNFQSCGFRPSCVTWLLPPVCRGGMDTALPHYDSSGCSCNSVRWSYPDMQGVCCYSQSCKLGESPCASQTYSWLTSMYVNGFWPQGLDMVKIF